MRATLVALVMLLLAPAAAADAMYATSQGSGGVNNIVYSASQEVPAAGKAYAAFGQGALSYSTTFSGTLGQDYMPGEWELRLNLSCDRPTVYRPTTTTDAYRPTLTSTLMVGGTTFAPVHGESQLRTCDGPSDVWEIVWLVDGSAAQPTAGAAVSWATNIWWVNPPPGEAQNGYYVLGAQGTGLFGLAPAPAPAGQEPAPIVVNATLVEPFNQTFGQPFTGTYNLTGGLEQNHTLQLNITQQDGEAVVTVRGGTGVTYNRTSTKGFNDTVALAPGNWSVVIALDSFQGVIKAAIVPVADAGSPGPGGQGSDPSDGGGSGSDASPTEDTPLPGVIVTVAITVALFLRRRSPKA